jgi:hypothetical protein
MSQKDSFLLMLDNLTEFMGRSEGQSTDEVIEELRSEGVDVDGAFQEFMKTVGECSSRSRRKDLEIARQRRIQAEANRKRQVSDRLKRTKEELIATIQTLVSSAPEPISVSWRDLESRNEEDLISLIEDLETAKQIQEEEVSDAE